MVAVSSLLAALFLSSALAAPGAAPHQRAVIAATCHVNYKAFVYEYIILYNTNKDKECGKSLLDNLRKIGAITEWGCQRNFNSEKVHFYAPVFLGLGAAVNRAFEDAYGGSAGCPK